MNILAATPGAMLFGSERGLTNLCRHLAPRHQISVVLPGKGTLSEQLSEIGGITLIYADMHAPPGTHSPVLLARSGLVQLRQIRKFETIISQTRPDLVYSNNTNMLAPGLAATKMGVPNVIHARGIHDRDIVAGWLMRVVLTRSARAMVCMSDFVRDYFVRVAPKSLRMSTIHDGLDFTAFDVLPKARSNDIPVIGMAAWIAPRKGQHLLLQALARLRQAGVSFTARIAGSAPTPQERPYEDEMHRLTKSLELDNCVEWVGYQSDVPKYLSGLDIFVVPSVLPEGFGLAALEAMAARLPVVGIDLGGLRELIVPNETGFLVQNSVEGLVSGLSTLLANPQARNRFGEAGYTRCKTRFVAHQAYSKIEEFLTEVSLMSRKTTSALN